jgi:hypothetical protein
MRTKHASRKEVSALSYFQTAFGETLKESVSFHVV